MLYSYMNLPVHLLGKLTSNIVGLKGYMRSKKGPRNPCSWRKSCMWPTVACMRDSKWCKMSCIHRRNHLEIVSHRLTHVSCASFWQCLISCNKPLTQGLGFVVPLQHGFEFRVQLILRLLHDLVHSLTVISKIGSTEGHARHLP